ncbi:MAG: hypothetical protein MUE42_03590 [Opitutaceae bacterium]|jgi:hypothetical protein|nr:hypothetical protein [Opitutaceae bacterium]
MIATARHDRRALLDEAKRRVPLTVAASALGLELRPNGLQRSPLRPDGKPSFSVTQDRLWHDFADGTGGDVVAFVGAAAGCNDGEAIKRLLALAGLDSGRDLAPLRLAPRPPTPPPPPKRDELTGLPLRTPTVGDLAHVAHQRGFAVFAGLELAHRRGMFWTASVPHRGDVVESWILTDAARKTGMARRMDGEPWQFRNGTAKSNALRSDDNHPPGLADVVEADRRAVLVAEGEPDALAALTCAWACGIADRVGVVCLPGASRGLSGPVIEGLAGRRVRILRQSDKPDANGKRPSHRAAAAWIASLTAAGISADVASLDGLTRRDGAPAKDVADLLRDAALEQLETLSAALLRGLCR